MDELLAGAIRALLLPPTVFWLLVVLGWACFMNAIRMKIRSQSQEFLPEQIRINPRAT